MKKFIIGIIIVSALSCTKNKEVPKSTTITGFVPAEETPNGVLPPIDSVAVHE